MIDVAAWYTRMYEGLAPWEFLICMRKKRGLTQKQLAELIGVNEKTIRRWEKSWDGIHPKYYKKLNDAFKIDNFVETDMIKRGRRARDARGNRTQSEFANLLGVCVATVVEWEKGNVSEELLTYVIEVMG